MPVISFIKTKCLLIATVYNNNNNLEQLFILHMPSDLTVYLDKNMN